MVNFEDQAFLSELKFGVPMLFSYEGMSVSQSSDYLHTSYFGGVVDEN